MMDAGFYKGKRVLVTGHTGFKGAWLCFILERLGAKVTGYALEPEEPYSLFKIAKVGQHMNSVIGDVRDYDSLYKVVNETKPEIVFHLAAQPIVRESYRDPRYTYETNIMGTVNILECIRQSSDVVSFVNITTDKVYKNNEWVWGYRESDLLDGYDVYSNSKSCSELVTKCYKRSFFMERELAVSTVRAGNVIGGGDFAKDRIIPDCIRAAVAHKPIIIRRPESIRPYQHVIEPLYVYMMIAEQQYKNPLLAGNYNVGPDADDCVQSLKLVQLFVDAWGEDAIWKVQADGGPHEANYLKLDNSMVKQKFGWKPVCSVKEAVQMVVEFTKLWNGEEEVTGCMEQQMNKYFT